HRLGGEDGRNEVVTFGGQHVLVRRAELADQPMSTEEPDLSSHACAVFAPIRRIGRQRVAEQVYEIAIAEATEMELATGCGLKKGDVFVAPGSEGTDPFAPPEDGSAYATDQLSKGSGGIDRRECVEVAFVASLGDLGPAMQIRDALAHGSPSAIILIPTFPRPENLEGMGGIDRGFDPQDAVLVIPLEGIAIHSVLDPNRFDPTATVADDLTGETGRYPTSKEAQHVASCRRS